MISFSDTAPLTRETLYLVASKAAVDVRTVRAVLGATPVQRHAAARLRVLAALRELGITVPPSGAAIGELPGPAR